MTNVEEKTKESEVADLPDASWIAAGSEAPRRFCKQERPSNCPNLSRARKRRRRGFSAVLSGIDFQNIDAASVIPEE